MLTWTEWNKIFGKTSILPTLFKQKNRLENRNYRKFINVSSTFCTRVIFISKLLSKFFCLLVFALLRNEGNKCAILFNKTFEMLCVDLCFIQANPKDILLLVYVSDLPSWSRFWWATQPKPSLIIFPSDSFRGFPLRSWNIIDRLTRSIFYDVCKVILYFKLKIFKENDSLIDLY